MNRKDREPKTDLDLGTESNGNMKRKNARKREAIFRFRSLPISVRENEAKALRAIHAQTHEHFWISELTHLDRNISGSRIVMNLRFGPKINHLSPHILVPKL